jgi:hypothetical protein
VANFVIANNHFSAPTGPLYALFFLPSPAAKNGVLFSASVLLEAVAAGCSADVLQFPLKAVPVSEEWAGGLLAAASDNCSVQLVLPSA